MALQKIGVVSACNNSNRVIANRKRNTFLKIFCCKNDFSDTHTQALSLQVANTFHDKDFPIHAFKIPETNLWKQKQYSQP